ncbi:MAG: hypothetical protein JWQ18_3021 [Conexibacter sp.]|nr:hypothetical protein [Conexibacter sp.]
MNGGAAAEIRAAIVVPGHDLREVVVRAPPSRALGRQPMPAPWRIG